MTKYKFYTFASIGLSVLFILITLIVSFYFLRTSTIANLDIEIEGATRLTDQVASMASTSLEKNVSPQDVIHSVQKAIGNTTQQNSFISIYDWSGTIVAYPDIVKVGTEAKSNALIANLKTTPNGEALYDILLSNLDTGEEIIYQQSIPNSDWIIAAHINTAHVIKRKGVFRNQIFLSFLIITLLVILFMLGAIRVISSYYEEQLSIKSQKFEDSFLNIGKLNTSLENYQKNLAVMPSVKVEKMDKIEEVIIDKETAKKRLLTYVRNELHSMPTEDLAYIYVDNTIIYVVRKDGKRATSNESLDQIFSNLDRKSFFRVNRQIIVAISAIELITKYGNKLKLQLKPEPEIDVFIGKNKASAFKQWLDI